MDILNKIFYFIIAIGVLVSFHEYGHFWVARRCGIKVIRFSIGFGKPLLRWLDKQGTEYVIAAVPLGGYVRMVDEREDDVAEEDLPYAFNRKPLWQRISVVLAGPVANFLLAILIYWIIFINGVFGVAAVVGEVQPGSIADRAGLTSNLEILAVDGVETPTRQTFHGQLVLRLGDSSEIQFTATPIDSDEVSEYSAMLGDWDVDSKNPNLLEAVGLTMYRPQILPIVGEVIKDSATEEAGLQVDDQILSADGVEMKGWDQWVEYLRQRPDQEIELVIDRNGDQLTKPITPKRFIEDDGSITARVGMGVKRQILSWPESMQRHYSYGPGAAFGEALDETWATVSMTLQMLKKMITGRISAEHLSGPLGIAKVAGQTAESGWVSYLKFLALLSVSLGVLNLLPIPVLDGGHLLYYLIEAVKGSPVSERIQMIGYRVGLFLVMGLMIFAISNDIRREIPDDTNKENNVSNQR